MNINIDTNETISIVAISIGGWGKGKTLHEALRNLRQASRGIVDKDFGTTLYPDGKERKYDFAEALENQQIRIWLTNDTTVTTEWFTFKPSEDKWAIFLGDCDNVALAYVGKEA